MDPEKIEKSIYIFKTFMPYANSVDQMFCGVSSGSTLFKANCLGPIYGMLGTNGLNGLK